MASSHRKLIPGIVIVISILYPAFTLFAQTKTADTHINIVVPHVLSVSCDTDQFTLTFDRHIAGSESDTKTVNYYVEANNISRISGILQAAVDVDNPDVVVKADVGTFRKEGGSASLVEANGGFIPLSKSPTDLANRTVDEGDGKVTRGTISVTYQAEAKKDLQYKQITPKVSVSIFDT